MTRNEQILSEVQKRFSSNDTHLVSKISTFIDGAKWADEHPKHGTVNKQEFMERACDYLQAVLEHDLGYYGALDFVARFIKVMEE